MTEGCKEEMSWVISSHNQITIETSIVTSDLRICTVKSPLSFSIVSTETSLQGSFVGISSKHCVGMRWASMYCCRLSNMFALAPYIFLASTNKSTVWWYRMTIKINKFPNLGLLCERYLLLQRRYNPSRYGTKSEFRFFRLQHCSGRRWVRVQRELLVVRLGIRRLNENTWAHLVPASLCTEDVQPAVERNRLWAKVD